MEDKMRLSLRLLSGLKRTKPLAGLPTLSQHKSQEVWGGCNISGTRKKKKRKRSEI